MAGYPDNKYTSINSPTHTPSVPPPPYAPSAPRPAPPQRPSVQQRAQMYGGGGGGGATPHNNAYAGNVQSPVAAPSHSQPQQPPQQYQPPQQPPQQYQQQQPTYQMPVYAPQPVYAQQPAYPPQPTIINNVIQQSAPPPTTQVTVVNVNNAPQQPLLDPKQNARSRRYGWMLGHGDWESPQRLSDPRVVFDVLAMALNTAMLVLFGIVLSQLDRFRSSPIVDSDLFTDTERESIQSLWTDAIIFFVISCLLWLISTGFTATRVLVASGNPKYADLEQRHALNPWAQRVRILNVFLQDVPLMIILLNYSTILLENGLSETVYFPTVFEAAIIVSLVSIVCSLIDVVLRIPSPMRGIIEFVSIIFWLIVVLFPVCCAVLNTYLAQGETELISEWLYLMAIVDVAIVSLGLFGMLFCWWCCCGCCVAAAVA